MKKKIRFSCKACGQPVVTTEEYKDCKYCAVCASERNDRARKDHAGEHALYTFYRLKDDGVL